MAQLLWTSALLVAATRLSGASAAREAPPGADPNAGSCPNCDNADNYLKPCNTSLAMSTWPGTFTYQPTALQAPCACNQNFYDQVQQCVACQTSDTAKLTIKPINDYKLVCQSLGQTNFPAVYIPGQASSTTGSSAPAETTSPSSGHPGYGVSHSSLSSGAVAGIIVSIIALVVALVVAAYVFTRRRRDVARQKEEDEIYKYHHHEGTHDSYMETPAPQYSGIHSSLPVMPQMTNLRVMNPDADEDEERNHPKHKSGEARAFEVQRASPGWRRGSFDDD